MRFRVIALIALLGLAVTACGDGSSAGGELRQDAVSGRWQTFDRATSMYPDPVTELQNFPLRGALRDMTLRQDLVNHPWYVYILGMDGNMIGYYVAKTVPINACNFLSSSEDVLYDQGSGGGGNLTLTSPSLDGMFYGNSQCDAWFFFDAATDALIQIRGMNYYASDVPLLVDAEPIRVEGGQP